MGYLAVLTMQRIDLSPLSVHYMLTGMEHFKQVHKHKESIDTAALELSTNLIWLHAVSSEKCCFVINDKCFIFHTQFNKIIMSYHATSVR